MPWRRLRRARDSHYPEREIIYREPAKLLLTDAAAAVQRTAERPAWMAYVQRQRPVESLTIKQIPSKKQPL